MVSLLPQGPSRLDGVRLLFVDSSSDERELFRARFEPLGATVLTAGTVAEALEMISDAEVDVVLTETALPDRDGYELIRRLRALGPRRGGGAPAIAVTGRVGPCETASALFAGFDAFVAKPYETEIVLAAILEQLPRIVERRKARTRVRQSAPDPFREQLRARRVLLQRRHAELLAAEGTSEERHLAKKTLALLTAQDIGESHFQSQLDDVEIAPPVRLDEERESWMATAVCGRELLTIEVVLGPSGRVEVRAGVE